MIVDTREKGQASVFAIRYLRIFGLSLVLLLVVCLALVHLCSPAWADWLFYNGDSITLALIAKSVRNGESFHWILSSQLFLFPEGLFYAVSNILVPSIKYSLLFNAALNLVCLFALYFLIAKSILKDVGKSQFFAISSVCLVVFYMLCELHPEINRRTIATPFLLTTYYYGVIVAALFLLYLHITLIKRSGTNTQGRAGVWLAGVAVVVTGLTYFSDPLLLLQFSVPFLGTLFLAWITGRLPRRDLVVATLIQLLGLLAGHVSRYLCRDMIGSAVNGYIDLKKIIFSIVDCWSIVVEISKNNLSLLEYSVMFAVLLVSIGMAIFLWGKNRRSFFYGDSTLSTIVLVVVVFSVVSPLFSIFGTIATGNSVTRYFMPLPFLPVLGLIPVFYIWNNFSHGKSLTFLLVVVVAASASYIPFGSARAGGIAPSESESVDCYNRFMAQQPFNAVGGFWTVRALDLYSTSGTRALQIVNLDRMQWMNNSSPYFKLSFNGVIIDKMVNGERVPNHIYADDVASFGAYTKKLSCKQFDIYYYDENSAGYRMLNAMLKK